jgi:uncharacterized protein DUF6677
VSDSPRAEARESDQATASVARGVSAAVAGWVLPGFGHLMLRRWASAAVYFLCVGGLAFTGLFMRGAVFGPGAPDMFDRLGFFADLGAGGFYFLAQLFHGIVSDIAHASGDYGTRMFATAGILNLLTVLEAFEIGSGRRA